MAKIFFCHSPQLIKFKKRMPTEIAAKWPHAYSIVIAIKQTLVDMLLTLLLCEMGGYPPYPLSVP